MEYSYLLFQILCEMNTDRRFIIRFFSPLDMQLEQYDVCYLFLSVYFSMRIVCKELNMDFCRFLFDSSCSDYKYYEYQLFEEEKALAQLKDSKASDSGRYHLCANFSLFSIFSMVNISFYVNIILDFLWKPMEAPQLLE